MRERLRDPEYAHGRRWYALIVLCLTLTIIGIDNSILNVALPTLARPTAAGGLGASASELQWIVDVYVLVFAGLLLTAGALGDRFGRLRFLNIGLALFGAGSIAAATAPSAGVLIGARALMGVGAACIMPATLSLITNIFTDPHERAKAIGAWAGVAAVGVGLGPLLGGLLIEHFSWGAVFLVNMPVVVTALVLGYFLVPESRDPSAPKLDPLGSVLSIIGLVSLVWAIIEGPSNGWTSASVIGAFVLAIVMLGLLLRVGAALSQPDARPALLREPALLGRERRDHPHLPRALRRGVPLHAVPPARARLLGRGGGRGHGADGRGHGRVRTPLAEAGDALRHQVGGGGGHGAVRHVRACS